MSDFEANVLKGLEKCGVNLSRLAADGLCLGAAVSGGADSVSLLVSLAGLCKRFSVPLKIITVNHYIRADEETCGDVEYVSSLCKKLCSQGYDISLKIHELKKGQVNELSQKKNIGIEAAARELRYAAFDSFINEQNISYLCLAHNKNDQLETILMRFLQGAGSDSSVGIPCVREQYVRPLLWTDRSSIETYLKEKNIEWRTDNTNNDNSYLRNRIRNELVPLLNDRFEGWDRGVTLGAQKAFDDSEVLKTMTQAFMDEHSKINKEEDGTVAVLLDGPSFYNLERAIKQRVLLCAANTAGFEQRIPYVFLLDICDYADNNKEDNCKNAVKSFSNLCVILKNNSVLIKKASELQKETVFSAIIQKSGMYEAPGGQVFVPDGLEFPVLLRSWRIDDSVQTADGGFKKVKDILADWHVALEQRQFIPVVQALNEPEQKILGVLGSCIGYKDWIVKNEKM